MKKACFFTLLFFLLSIFCGCSKLAQHLRNNLQTTASTTNTVSASEADARTREQVLADFKALEPHNIRAIDIVVVRNAEPVERVVKNFTSAADIQAILSILATADAENTDARKASNGWAIMSRIWLQKQEKTNLENPILVSPQTPGYIVINNYVYAVESDAYIAVLTSFFEASSIQEEVYS